MRTRTPFLVRLRDDSGATAIIVAVSMTAVLAAGMLSMDAGSTWKVRRALITYTDAAALAAARYIQANGPSACSSAVSQALSSTAGSDASYVIKQNEAQVTIENFVVSPGAAGCMGGSGRVRVDARMPISTTFAGVFGFKDLSAFASSTAQWGQITTINGGLRPIGICDQSNVTWPASLPFPPPSSGPYPHFELWNRLRRGQITQFQYDRYFGVKSTEYPSVSPVTGQRYLSPSNGGGVVHHVNARDICRGPANWRGWLDLAGNDGATDVKNHIVNGYAGPVSLQPKICTAGNPGGKGWCGNKPGNVNGVQADLDTIRCPTSTPTKDCFKFPIIVYDQVVDNGRDTFLDQVAFIQVVLRDHMNCQSNTGCEFDLEFVEALIDGPVGTVGGGRASIAGMQLCGGNYGITIDTRCDV